MSIEAQPQAHNLFSFQIDWIKDKLDEIDANESPLAPTQTRGIYSSSVASTSFLKLTRRLLLLLLLKMWWSQRALQGRKHFNDNTKNFLLQFFTGEQVTFDWQS